MSKEVRKSPNQQQDVGQTPRPDSVDSNLSEAWKVVRALEDNLDNFVGRLEPSPARPTGPISPDPTVPIKAQSILSCLNVCAARFAEIEKIIFG